jgi:hypothetical protein
MEAVSRAQRGRAQQDRNALDDRIIGPVAGDETAFSKRKRLTFDRVDESIAQPMLHPA